MLLITVGSLAVPAVSGSLRKIENVASPVSFSHVRHGWSVLHCGSGSVTRVSTSEIIVLDLADGESPGMPTSESITN